MPSQTVPTSFTKCSHSHPSQTPYLSAKSAELMAKAAEQAIEYSENGMKPDDAVVKAASLYKLAAPLAKHVAYAFNIGKAASIRSASADAWTKASAYTICDPENVYKMMSGGVEPSKSHTKISKDFKFAPIPLEEAPVVNMQKLASCFGVEYKEEEKQEKKAEAKPLLNSVNNKEEQLSEFQLKMALAETVSAAKDVAKLIPMPEYRGAKSLAVKMYPYVSPIMFMKIDNDGIVCKKASADNTTGQDTVPINHKLIKLAAKFEKLATEFVNRFSKHQPAKTLLTPILPGDWAKIAEDKEWDSDSGKADPVDIKKNQPAGKTLTQKLLSPFSPGKMPYTGMGSQYAAKFRDDVNKMRTVHAEQMAAKVLDRNMTEPIEAIKRVESDVDSQSTVNNLLADPAFREVSPQDFFKAYKEVSSVAPTAMSTPALAKQVMNLRMQTGPLSMFDIKTLVEIEAKMNQARRDQSDFD